jgi:hypothetical protein
MSRVRVRKLTGSNVLALQELEVADRIGATWAEWDASQDEALDRVQSVMDSLPVRRGHPYASLVAVRNKLSGRSPGFVFDV